MVNGFHIEPVPRVALRPFMPHGGGLHDDAVTVLGRDEEPTAGRLGGFGRLCARVSTTYFWDPAVEIASLHDALIWEPLQDRVVILATSRPERIEPMLGLSAFLGSLGMAKVAVLVLPADPEAIDGLLWATFRPRGER